MSSSILLHWIPSIWWKLLHLDVWTESFPCIPGSPIVIKSLTYKTISGISNRHKKYNFSFPQTPLPNTHINLFSSHLSHFSNKIPIFWLLRLKYLGTSLDSFLFLTPTSNLSEHFPVLPSKYIKTLITFHYLYYVTPVQTTIICFSGSFH